MIFYNKEAGVFQDVKEVSGDEVKAQIVAKQNQIANFQSDIDARMADIQTLQSDIDALNAQLDIQISTADAQPLKP